jgi:hypothetical protein
MPTIHFDFLMGGAAIDILTLLTISIGIIGELYRDHRQHGRTAPTQRQSLEV